MKDNLSGNELSHLQKEIANLSLFSLLLRDNAMTQTANSKTMRHLFPTLILYFFVLKNLNFSPEKFLEMWLVNVEKHTKAFLLKRNMPTVKFLWLGSNDAEWMIQSRNTKLLRRSFSAWIMSSNLNSKILLRVLRLG